MPLYPLSPSVEVGTPSSAFQIALTAEPDCALKYKVNTCTDKVPWRTHWNAHVYIERAT